VYQSARGLVARGYQAHVCADAVSSRTKTSWRVGLDLIEKSGAIVTTTEASVFDLLRVAGTDDFKALSKLIK
jgi:nicotinamidase-related amidase